ncbi:hypothetical protein PRIPAC_77560 [Pristionchus pacificus]|uniref:Acyltransferase n=1 Tax=Pristionchus pacificus TaxID=54126 RepID=A0A2A6CPV8_PRIPA|nr:hypothetical protein PRIPAC_77560 [Pristionchus pacificus]|eukprot:PDM80097.1 Acyltransferase [Pristionchus pacificus]
MGTYYNFYFKRLRRILPLALLIVLLCVITISALLTDFEFTNGMKSALYSMFFVKNYQPHPTVEEDYFQALEKANDLFTHFWSLCVEIQFYLIAPFVLHLFKPTTENAFINFTFLAAISAVSFAYSFLSNQKEAFDATPARLWQFLAGATAFHSDLLLTRPIRIPLPVNEETADLLPSKGTSLQEDEETGECEQENADVLSGNKALAIPCGFAVAASVAVLVSRDWEIVLRFYTTFFAALVLFFRSQSVFLCHKSLQIIGDSSYSLYLIHWPIVCVLEILDIDEWQAKVVAMAAAVALSILCHHGYEKRQVQYLTLSAKSTLALVLGLYIAIFCAMGAGTHIQQDATEQEATPSSLMVGPLPELSQSEIDRQNRILSKTNDLRYKGCKLKYGWNPIGFCDLENGNGTLSFLIMGNSYSANLGGLVQKNFKEHYGKLQARAIAQCEPLVNTAHDHYCPNYKDAHAKFDADIERERPDILFLIARYIKPNAPITRPIENDDKFKLMEGRLKFFEEHVNKKVFILTAFPTPARGDDFDRKMKRLGKPMAPYMPLAEKCSKCVIFDIEPMFLNEAGNFTVLSPQKLQYFDNPRHLNNLGKQLVEPVFKRLSENFDRLLETKYPENIFV